MPAPLSQRQSTILQRIRETGTCQVSALARDLGVSLETIRRDVKVLVAAREVLKRHGAVVMPYEVGEAPFERRLRENAEAKRAIARRAAQDIDDGDSLMLDAGTTSSFFARELLRKRHLTVITNSSDIARTLATVNGNRVYMAGGELNGDLGAAFGPSTIAFAATFRVRHAIITASALSPSDGPMDYRLDEAEFARTVLSRGEKRTLLCDHSKFGQTALIRICGFDEIDMLVTSAALPDDLAVRLKEAGTRVELASPRLI